MILERKKNATRNILFGSILRVYQTIVPFGMRTAMIYFMGVQYLGLNSLFISVLQVLNLAELGVGSAMVYNMYKPIIDDDTNTICALLKLYRAYYRIIGSIIAIIGSVLIPIIPKLISGDIPADLNIYILYLLNLTATVLSYWLFAYKNSLFQAYQRTDIISKISIVTTTVQYGLQLYVIVTFHNYYYYLIINLAIQVINNIITAVVAAKKYPQYKPEGKLDSTLVKEINQKVRDLFTAKLGSMILNSSDTLVISGFLGLTALAVYQNYYFILTAIIGFVAIIFGSCTAGIGNSIIIESKKKNYNDLLKLTFLICWLSGFCSSSFLSLYQPFMKLWVGEELMLNFGVVICLSVYFYIYEINQLLNTFKEAGGIWHKDRYRPLVTAIANLGMNILSVKVLGIYGVILSTVISILMIGLPWLIYNVFSTLLEKKYMINYLKKLIFYTSISFVSCMSTTIANSFINFLPLKTLITRGLICCIFPNTIFYLVYRNSIEYKQCRDMIKAMIKNKIYK